MRQWLFRSGLIAAVLCVAALSVPSRAGAQEAKVRPEVPSTGVTVDDGQFQVEVVVEDVANLGAFQFTLSYDASLLRFVAADKGPFLGSSGRIVECLDPRVEPGSVLMLCVTLGPEPPGPDGSGTLATVTFDALGTGITPLRLGGLTLARPDAQRIPAGSEDASITLAAGAVYVTPIPVATSTAAPAETSTAAPAETAPTVAPADLTATEPVSAEGTPTFGATPASADTTDGGSTNWALWGSVIGAVAVLIAAAAGVAWWSRARKAA